MKSECKEFLEEYIERHYRENGEEYDFYTLFKHFSAFEISKKEDILPAIDDFFAFLSRCDEAICKSNIHNPLKLVKYSAKVMKRFFAIPLSSQQRSFADLVKSVAPKKEDTILLEVGAGMYPKTAFYLAETYQNVSAIDKQFVLSSTSMKSMNVTAYQQLFDINTQIKEYDFVVGRNPCSAVDSIVKSCVRENKPYLIELCECGLPKEKRNSSPTFGWEEILKSYDPNIQIGKNGIVYNLDASPRQVEKILNSNGQRKMSIVRKVDLITNNIPFQIEFGM